MGGERDLVNQYLRNADEGTYRIHHSERGIALQQKDLECMQQLPLRFVAAAQTGLFKEKPCSDSLNSGTANAS